MAALKQYKKRRKELKAEIRDIKAHLKELKKQLKGLRHDQQHQAVDRIDTMLEQKPSLLGNLKKLLKL